MDERVAIVVAGDDAEVKQTVMKLIDEIGFAPVDSGSLHAGGKKQEPNTAIYGKQVSPQEAQTILAGS